MSLDIETSMAYRPNKMRKMCWKKNVGIECLASSACRLIFKVDVCVYGDAVRVTQRTM